MRGLIRRAAVVAVGVAVAGGVAVSGGAAMAEPVGPVPKPKRTVCKTAPITSKVWCPHGSTY